MLPLALLVVLSAPAHAFEAGVVPAVHKVLWDEPVPGAREARLQAARGEWEAFQVVVRGAGPLTDVDVVIGDLAGPEGAAIPGSAAVRYREVFVAADTASPGGVTYYEREPGLYPDPLVPFVDPWDGDAVGGPFDLAAGEPGVVYVDLRVPAGAVPGTYSGVATVSAAGAEPVEIAVSVEVWPFDLSTRHTVATAYGVWEDRIRGFHGGPGETSADYAAIVARYYDVLHENRVDPTSLGGPLSFAFDEEGTLLPVDFTAYDAAVGPWLDGTRFADGVPVSRFNAGWFAPGWGTGSWTADQHAQAARAFAEHLDTMGWWDRAYVYAIDEPWLNGGDAAYAAIHRDVQALLAASELWRGHVLVTSPYDTSIDGDIGIWCPVTPMYEDWFLMWGDLAGRDLYAERMALGEELWFYVCNANFPPYAGYDVDTAIGFEPRIAKWGAWYERASGFLFWSVTFWPENDPWNVLADVGTFGAFAARNGDGFLLYPGDHDGTAGGKGSPADVSMDGPVASYRLKQVRDGLEDWEMFRLAAELGAEDYAREQVARAYTRFGSFLAEDCDMAGFYCPDDPPWTTDEALVAEVRANIGAKVAFLVDPARWPDPEAAPVDTGHGEVRGGGCGCASRGGAGVGSALATLAIAAGIAGATRRRWAAGR